MMQNLIMITLMINTILFTQMTHPLSMGMILLIQTILTCMKSGLETSNFWFSYILFLIFIGGMLILFMYMSSLSSNEKMKLNSSFLMKITLLTFTMMIILMLMDKMMLMKNFNNTDMLNINSQQWMIKENYLTISKLYETPNNFLTLMMILYLLLTLIIVVKITNSFMGPLRPKN